MLIARPFSSGLGRLTKHGRAQKSSLFAPARGGLPYFVDYLRAWPYIFDMD
jgi:hypothetical protein